MFTAEVERLLNVMIGQNRSIITLLTTLTKEGQQTMAALDDLTAAVTREVSVDASAVTLLQGLAKLLADAVAANDPAKIAALSAQLTTSADSLAAAVTANTPA